MNIKEILLESGCIKLGNFILKSGNESKYYIDMSQLFAHPYHMDKIISIIKYQKINIQTDFVFSKYASIELRGALLASIISYDAYMPLIVIRKEYKKYGIIGRITGAYPNKDDNVLLIDDVLSEGSSKLEAIKVLEEQGCKVKAVFVIVDREMGGKELLESKGYKVYSLAKISDIIKEDKQ
jgi:uridine monophosphate synthetase